MTIFKDAYKEILLTALLGFFYWLLVLPVWLVVLLATVISIAYLASRYVYPAQRYRKFKLTCIYALAVFASAVTIVTKLYLDIHRVDKASTLMIVSDAFSQNNQRHLQLLREGYRYSPLGSQIVVIPHDSLMPLVDWIISSNELIRSYVYIKQTEDDYRASFVIPAMQYIESLGLPITYGRDLEDIDHEDGRVFPSRTFFANNGLFHLSLIYSPKEYESSVGATAAVFEGGGVINSPFREIVIKNSEIGVMVNQLNVYQSVESQLFSGAKKSACKTVFMNSSHIFSETDTPLRSLLLKYYWDCSKAKGVEWLLNKIKSNPELLNDDRIVEIANSLVNRYLYKGMSVNKMKGLSSGLESEIIDETVGVLVECGNAIYNEEWPTCIISQYLDNTSVFSTVDSLFAPIGILHTLYEGVLFNQYIELDISPPKVLPDLLSFIEVHSLRQLCESKRKTAQQSTANDSFRKLDIGSDFSFRTQYFDHLDKNNLYSDHRTKESLKSLCSESSSTVSKVNFNMEVLVDHINDGVDFLSKNPFPEEVHKRGRPYLLKNRPWIREFLANSSFVNDQQISIMESLLYAGGKFLPSEVVEGFNLHCIYEKPCFQKVDINYSALLLAKDPMFKLFALSQSKYDGDDKFNRAKDNVYRIYPEYSRIEHNELQPLSVMVDTAGGGVKGISNAITNSLYAEFWDEKFVEALDVNTGKAVTLALCSLVITTVPKGVEESDFQCIEQGQSKH